MAFQGFWAFKMMRGAEELGTAPPAMERPASAAMPLRVCILYPGADLAGFPGARNLAVGLGERGFSTKVLLLRRQAVPICRLGPNVTLVDLSGVRALRRRLLGLPALIPITHRVLRWLYTEGRSMDVVVGVDRAGVVLAWFGSWRARFTLASLLVEFYLPPKWSGFWNWLGNVIEGAAYRRCVINLVQDDGRARLLQERHHLASASLVRFPNSPVGRANRERSSYAYDLFEIPKDRKIILQAGVLDHGTCFRDVLREAELFPPDWTTVFQASRPLEPGAWATRPQTQVVVNPRPLPYEHVEPLVRSATVGLALYRVLSDNTLVKGAAAGKVAMYLKCGVPVVLQALPSFRPFVEKYGCGVLVERPQEIRSAVETILNDYERFREGALACFNAEFALDGQLDLLADLLRRHA